MKKRKRIPVVVLSGLLYVKACPQQLISAALKTAFRD